MRIKRYILMLTLQDVLADPNAKPFVRYYCGDERFDPWSKNRDDAYRFTLQERRALHLNRHEREVVAKYGRWIRDRHAKVTPTRRSRPDDKALYVNVYDVDRGYGGPEEGGWWYDYGNPAHGWRSEKFYNEDKAGDRCRALNTSFDAEARSRGSRGNPSSVLFEGRLRAFLEPHPPRAFPDQRPHYE